MPEVEATPTKPTSNSLLAISADNADFVSQLDVLEDGSGSIYSLVMSPDGGRLASAGADGLIRLWSPRDGDLEGSLPGHEVAVNSLAFNRDGSVLASAGDDGLVRLWAVAAGQMTLEMSGAAGEGPAAPLTAVAFQPGGELVAAGNNLAAANVSLWDAGTGEAGRTLEQHAGPVRALQFSPDGSVLAVAVESAGRGAPLVYLYDGANGQVVRTLGETEEMAAATSLAFAADGALVAAGSSLGHIEMWDVASGELVHRLEGHEGGVQVVAFSPNGRTLASGGVDGAGRLWDVESGRFLRALERHEGAVNGLAFRPDGYLLFTAGEDGTIRVWGMPVP
jgi:WD40 repeat protein